MDFIFQANSFVKEDPFKTKIKMYLGEEDTLAETVKHNFRIFRDYGNNENIEKFVVFALSSAELNPSVKMFDILMRDVLKEKFQLEPIDLESKWSKQCWNCFKSPEELKTCQGCKKSKYCDRACQQKEWPKHKLLHKEMEFTKEILAAAADEDQQ